jgi:hypothetical protein
MCIPQIPIFFSFFLLMLSGANANHQIQPSISSNIFLCIHKTRDSHNNYDERKGKMRFSFSRNPPLHQTELITTLTPKNDLFIGVRTTFENLFPGYIFPFSFILVWIQRLHPQFTRPHIDSPNQLILTASLKICFQVIFFPFLLSLFG